MSSVISVSNLSKVYSSGFKALNNINLDIKRGEIFALLGPNGAGKTTLISIICGIVNPSDGSVTVDGHDIIRDYRPARSMKWMEIALALAMLGVGVYEIAHGFAKIKSRGGQLHRHGSR